MEAKVATTNVNIAGERLKGKVAVVIGAGQSPGEGVGNGRAAAIRFAREGARVVAVDRNLESAEETASLILAEGLQCVAASADVTREADAQAAIAAAVAQFGTVDILVNCAGTNDRKAPDQYSLAEWNDLIAVNLTRPGVGVELVATADTLQVQQMTTNRPTLSSVLEHTVPASFVDAAAKNEVLQIVFFSVLFAVGLAQSRSRHKATMLSFFEGLAESTERP